jgi:predicted CXXCH cytochrome family protein
MKQTLLLLAAVALLATPALAFHDGGVAECGGCHSMHSAESSTFLLVKSDTSSTCLDCHESVGDTGPTRYHISTPAAELVNDTDVVKQRTPGGDFGWLRQDLTATATYYATIENFGYQRGHNIIAADNAYTVDLENTAAPGGTMPSNQLDCASCHDPHGQSRIDSTGAVVFPAIGTTFPPIVDSGSYGTIPGAGEAVGVYRLLGGASYTAWDAINFPGAPAAIVPSTYNRSEDVTPTRVAYGYGTTNGFQTWGRWCGTCHPGMHTDAPGAPGGQVHPVDDTLGNEATNYNAYVKTGDLTGSSTSSFTSLVPFSTSSTDIATLAALANNDGSDLNGPTGGDRLNCMSCHRAHAGGWKYILRWNGEAEFLTLGAPATPIYPGVDAGLGNQGQFNRGYTTAQMEAAYYDRPADLEFAGHQRVLCNKCHLKD